MFGVSSRSHYIQRERRQRRAQYADDSTAEFNRETSGRAHTLLLLPVLKIMYNNLFTVLLFNELETRLYYMQGLRSDPRLASGHGSIN